MLPNEDYKFHEQHVHYYNFNATLTPQLKYEFYYKIPPDKKESPISIQTEALTL